MRNSPDAPVKALGYVRVSTAEQAASGLGTAAQRAAIEAECTRRGWELVDVLGDDGVTGKTLARPGLYAALNHLASRQADVLVVAKLDRVSRSVQDFARILDWFDRAECTFVALDLSVDTSTPGGRLVANVLASVAEWEVAIISARTRDGLAAKRAGGGTISRPAVADRPELLALIQGLRAHGLTFQAIANRLNHDGHPTLRGGSRWRPSSVQSALGYRRPIQRSSGSDLPPVPPRRAAA